MNWITVYKDKNKYKVELLKNELLNNGIEAVVMDKIDQSYPVIGSAEIKVEESKKEAAENLIKDFIFND